MILHWMEGGSFEENFGTNNQVVNAIRIYLEHVNSIANTKENSTSLEFGECPIFWCGCKLLCTKLVAETLHTVMLDKGRKHNAHTEFV